MAVPRTKVLVAMSGGVDSSLAAALLLEQGYEVVGGFMKNWSGAIRTPRADGTFEFAECDWKSERRDALRVAGHLGIPLKTFDFEQEYRARVFEYMLREYEAGRTPNPDVMCNREVKFDLLLKAADDLGCAFLATGHYARVRDGRLLKGSDETKNQSYFLCRLGQKELQRALFPIGEFKKTEVRKMAAARGLPTAEKKDSQGLCFVGKVNMPAFLKERLKVAPGRTVTTSGKVIGKHDGVQFYTIGQRQGIGVGGGRPWFVVERRVENNELVVGHEDDPALFATSLTATDVHWVSGVALSFPWRGMAQIRYHQEDQGCSVSSPLPRGSERGCGELLVTFDTPQRAVAPGQFVVFYDGDELIGSGVIEWAMR